MMPESNRARWFFYRAAALVVPIVAVPIVTFTLLDWGHTATLNDPNPAVRVAAVRETGWRGHIDLLTRASQDEDADVRLVAAIYLKRRREKAGGSATALIALLKDKHKGVRREAIEALSFIGAPAVPALIEALADPDPQVRSGAIDGLSGVGRWKEPRKRTAQELGLVIPALEKLREDEDPKVRQKAVRSLEALRRSSTDGV